MGQLDYKPSWFSRVKLVNLVLIGLIVTSGLAYLMGINNLVVQGFKLQELKHRAEILASEKEQIETRKVALESYSDIGSKLQTLRMVPVDKIEYLTITDEQIAKK